MKKSKIAVAMFTVVIAAASFVRAEGFGVDFDKGSFRTADFMEAVKARNDNMTCEQPKPASISDDAGVSAKAVDAKVVEVKVIVKNGASIKEEKLICQAGEEGQVVNNCTKQRDLTPLKQEELAPLFLRKYVPISGEGFGLLLKETRHSYCNNSGPQTFCCNDVCRTWVVTQIVVGVVNGLPMYQQIRTCGEWTHTCACTNNCY